MGALTVIRADLTAAVTGQVSDGSGVVPVLDVLPEAWYPPVILLSPGDPFLSPGDRLPYGVASVRYDLLVIVANGTNPAQAVSVESLIEQTLAAIYSSAHDWTVPTVSAPFDLTTSLGTFLACKVTVTRPARIATT